MFVLSSKYRELELQNSLLKDSNKIKTEIISDFKKLINDIYSDPEMSKKSIKVLDKLLEEIDYAI